MKTFELSKLDPERDADGHGYVDFLASDLLSVGYAVWPAGGEDRQQPHEEDEVYQVVSGRGSIASAGLLGASSPPVVTLAPVP
jgi:hypothetical protein